MVDNHAVQLEVVLAFECMYGGNLVSLICRVVVSALFLSVYYAAQGEQFWLLSSCGLQKFPKCGPLN